jgi:hypothetical protein
MTEKTHYRKAFDSPYLSSADIVDPVVLTIKRVTLEPDRTKKTKDEFNTAWFSERELRPGEPLKPMILNATNSKMLATLTGSKWIDDWVNVCVTVYVDAHVRFGKETVEGLRIEKATERPRSAPTSLIEAGESAARRGTDELRAWWTEQLESDRVLMLSRFKALKATAVGVDTAARAKAEESQS